MRTAVGSVLLALLSGVAWFLYQRGVEPKLGAPPAELKSAFHTEEEWMVGEIVRDIAEMGQFARASRFDPASVKIVVSRAAGPADAWSATVTLPGRAVVAVELPLRTGVWSPAEYEPVARRVMEGLGGKEAPSNDETLLGTLRDLRAGVIERENQRISKRLEQGMSSSAAHEEAALLMGAFALREAAGWFSDHRQMFCRMAAHLALADALRGGPERGLAGRYAYTTLLILSRRTAEGLGALDTLDRRVGDSAIQAAWSRALRLRATDDWRMLGEPKTRSLLERLEYYRALVNSSMEALALAMGMDGTLEPVADWGRVTTARTVNVEEGNHFFRVALDREQAEMVEVREASGLPPLSAAGLVQALNEPAGRCLTPAGPRVIGWGTWAAFVQRHIGEHVHRVDLFLRRSLDLEQAADASQAQLDRDWGGLVLFPMAACFRTRGQEQNFDRIRDAIDVALARPELMVALNWAHLESGTRYEVLERGMARSEDWFTTGLPRGTVYDSFWRLERLKTARAHEAGVLEALAAVDPYNQDIARRRTETLARRNGRGDELLKVLGPRADYDVGALGEVSAALEKRPQEQLAIVERLCEIDPYHCVQLGFAQAWRGLDEQAAASFERAIAAPSVDRVRASHAAPWLGRYYRKHGQPQKALEIATQAAETGSGSGYNALAEHWEALGRFVEAERYQVEGSDRYKDPKYDCDSSLVAFYYRMARVRNKDAFEPKLQRCLAKTFPQGLQHVELKDVSGPPTDGVFVNGHSDETMKQGIWAGDVIVGLDGWRVRTTEQYWAVNNFTPDEVEDMTFLLWKAGAYREIKAKFRDRALYVDLDNYPLKGWVEK
jgi:tetratricopeptide (TPR) repeat protein